MARATVTPPRDGSYELRAATVAEASSGFAVALGESIGGRIVRAILGALAIGALLTLAGIGLIVATSVRRRRRTTPSAPPPPPPAPAGIAGLEG